LWASSHCPGFSLGAAEPESIDDSLARFINHNYRTGQPVYVARHAILAVIWERRELRYRLHHAWDSLKSWEKKCPTKSRVPFSAETVLLLFLLSLELGCNATEVQRRALILAGVLFRVMFFALLRPGEMFGLRAKDVKFVYQRSGRLIAILALRRPKNRAFLGNTQFAIVRDEATCRWLQWMLADWPADFAVWPGSRVQFRAVFDILIQAAGCELAGFTPASFRPGGTTFFYVEGVTPDRLQYWGRWASSLSLRSYIQESMSALVWADLHLSLQEVAARLKRFASIIETPPAVPWPRFTSDGFQRRASAASRT